MDLDMKHRLGATAIHSRGKRGERAELCTGTCGCIAGNRDVAE